MDNGQWLCSLRERIEMIAEGNTEIVNYQLSIVNSPAVRRKGGNK